MDLPYPVEPPSFEEIVEYQNFEHTPHVTVIHTTIRYCKHSGVNKQVYKVKVECWYDDNEKEWDIQGSVENARETLKKVKMAARAVKTN